MINTDHRNGLVSLTVFGEFTLADFNEFEDLIRFKVPFDGPLDIWVDLRQMASFTLDVAWEEICFSRTHQNDFRRIAILTDNQWISWSAWLSQAFVNADLRVFDDEVEARSWLGEVV